MCGICGAVGVESKESSEAIVQRMTAALTHRGPDDRRISFLTLYYPGHEAPQHHRPARSGSQPVWNETQTLAVVFNGEIYNFREVRKQLQDVGHRFRTRSDTEAIVHAYEEWGESCVRRFRGMFAFAVVEMPQGPAGTARSVLIARDPLGIKPLYYTLVDGALIFASEVRALLASGCVPARLSSQAVRAYLLFGSVGEPLTLVEGVFSLPPGHSMRISATRPIGPLKPKSYAFAGSDEPRQDGEGKFLPREEGLRPLGGCDPCWRRP